MILSGITSWILAFSLISSADIRTNDNLLNMLKNTVPDTGGILIAPKDWDGNDWLKASSVVAGVALLSTQDDEIRDFAQSNRTATTDGAASAFEKLGNGVYVLPALGISYATALFIKDRKLQTTALTAFEATLVASVLTTLGKYAFHRERPDVASDQYQFHGPSFSSSHLSFPSGHTGTAFAIATVFAEAYDDSKFVPILAYSSSALVGLSRIHDNKHWASDVAMGAAVGWATGKFVAKRLNRDTSEPQVLIFPNGGFANGGSAGLNVVIPIRHKKRR